LITRGGNFVKPLKEFARWQVKLVRYIAWLLGFMSTLHMVVWNSLLGCASMKKRKANPEENRK
jgi:hypothetical protein